MINPPSTELTGGDAIGWNIHSAQDGKPYIQVRPCTADLFMATVNWKKNYLFQRRTRYKRKPNLWQVLDLSKAGREPVLEGVDPNELLRRIWDGELGDHAALTAATAKEGDALH